MEESQDLLSFWRTNAQGKKQMDARKHTGRHCGSHGHLIGVTRPLPRPNFIRVFFMVVLPFSQNYDWSPHYRDQNLPVENGSFRKQTVWDQILPSLSSLLFSVFPFQAPSSNLYEFSQPSPCNSTAHPLFPLLPALHMKRKDVSHALQLSTGYPNDSAEKLSRSRGPRTSLLCCKGHSSAP